MTTKGFKEGDFEQVVEILDDCVKIVQNILVPGMKFKEFKECLENVDVSGIKLKVIK
jgi:glycine/serine hydroxymethyltransferase